MRDNAGRKKKCFNMHFKMTAQWMDQRTDDF